MRAKYSCTGVRCESNIFQAAASSLKSGFWSSLRMMGAYGATALVGIVPPLIQHARNGQRSHFLAGRRGDRQIDGFGLLLVNRMVWIVGGERAIVQHVGQSLFRRIM